MNRIQEGLHAVYERVARAAQAAGRHPDDVLVLAVSKAFPAQCVFEATRCGQRAFGENYAREGVAKMAEVASLMNAEDETAATSRHAESRETGLPVLRRGGELFGEPRRGLPQWHFIGPIQSNKTRLIAEHFDWIHSIDRWQVAQRLSEQRPAELPVLQACIQVNLSGEITKSGVDPEGLAILARQMAGLPRLRLRGLMAIPELTADVQYQRSQFRMLREMKTTLAAEGIVLDTLSMGMSDDLEAAIREGATIVRIGRAIFGERRAKQL